MANNENEFYDNVIKVYENLLNELRAKRLKLDEKVKDDKIINLRIPLDVTQDMIIFDWYCNEYIKSTTIGITTTQCQTENDTTHSVCTAYAAVINSLVSNVVYEYQPGSIKLTIKY